MTLLRFVLWVVWLLTLRIGAVAAHPGGLDAQGCHWTRSPFRYTDGRVVRQGSHHCHRPLGMLQLDGRELLTEPKDDAQGQRLPERPDGADFFEAPLPGGGG